MSDAPVDYNTKAARSLRILIVEDHADTLRVLARLLGHFGHEISTADSQASAMRFLEAKRFDVLLSDIALPDGNGYEVVSHAKQTQPVKAVALTGFDRDEDLERGREAGFDFHLTKPVDFHELRNVLEKITA
jgi:CheY-like chemotaxis protein